ncbi:hypothetical protein [Pseudophaeobacter leonis]|uniref:hypothetical protein n=1 Tax=Pseudophaeobacter leonis TaxID=1144477 RepID=UPI0009F4D9FA|nr:hypothetical protein [Pseudophaeobacter leonis]
MAFVGIMVGSFFGLISAATGFALFDLHLWQSLLLYSASGVLFSVLTVLALLLRPRIEGQKAEPTKAQATA